ncbi:endonuclease V [Morus notabilis]|uniref:endonuclease V n=1 Tax=Morus notabilis TaxID=981085 RepID=UPI000CED529E|nr:endonuclease V [Morus notabilis]
MANSNLDTDNESQCGTEPAPPPSNWEESQDSMKKKLIAEDEFVSTEALRYVGGVDISFSKEDPSVACGTLVVLELHSLRVVYEDFSVVTLHVPYVPGFLAFREAPVLLELLEKMKNNANPFYPQVLMVDGNGVLHPRGFGLACHLGVLANLPTIGVGKNLHHVDGLTLSRVKELLKAREHLAEDFITLTGDSGRIWGVAMRSTGGSLKPIFVSIGHRMSLDTAVAIVKMTCKYRVPEPIRQADIRSREYLRKHRV